VSGDPRHTRAVRQLRQAYEALPPDAPIRLAKRTSNLFRFPRARERGQRGSGGARETQRGLDVSGLDQVLAVDPAARTAEVQGMATYETIVDATLAHGLMPLVVPQLKTITLGGAVAGLGIESSSFRNGLPHESVRELEVLTGDGRVVVATPSNEHAGLFHAFPNSYGTLGYSLRLVIDLEPVKPFVRLRHLRFATAEQCLDVMAQICTEGRHEGEPVDFVDGTVFSPDEQYITVGSFVNEAPAVSDYTGMGIYYQSIRQRAEDWLSIRDYLWRWDTDWFWCSQAFGVQRSAVRRLWPRRYRRSDVYRRIVAFDRRHQLTARLARARGRRPDEAVVQDVEIPIEATAKFLDVFHRDVGISPIWLCPLRLRSAQPWPLYPLEPDELYVNLGFWSSVPLSAGQADDHHNRLVEDEVHALGGHKSLYSTVHYAEDEFWQRYNGAAYHTVKAVYDPNRRLPDLYDKVRG